MPESELSPFPWYEHKCYSASQNKTHDTTIKSTQNKYKKERACIRKRVLEGRTISNTLGDLKTKSLVFSPNFCSLNKKKNYIYVHKSKFCIMVPASRKQHVTVCCALPPWQTPPRGKKEPTMACELFALPLGKPLLFVGVPCIVWWSLPTSYGIA